MRGRSEQTGRKKNEKNRGEGRRTEKKPKERERGEEEERTERKEKRGKENQRRRRKGKETEEKERGRIPLSAAWDSSAAAWSRRQWAATPLPASITAPPETQQATASASASASAPGNFSSPSFSRLFFSFPSLHAERVAFCMQGWGENNSPRPFWLGPGGSWPSPVFWAGSGPEENVSFFLGRDRPNPFWAEIGQTILGWVRPSWLGRPSLNLILYIIYIIFCITYIYIYMWKITKILQKLF